MGSHAEKIKIGIIFDFSRKWMGGIYYYNSIIKSIYYLPEDERPEIVLFYTEKYEEFIKDLEFPFLVKIKIKTTLNGNLVLRFIKSVLKRKNLFYSHLAQEHNLDGIYAINDYPIKELKNKQEIVAAWIPDLQHIFYPEFFKKQRLLFRKLRILFLIRNASNLVVSSNDVKRHFYENFKIPISLKIHTVRFSSINEPIIHDRQHILTKYKIDKPYFIVCNQFLKHKNHLIVLQAAKILVGRGKEFLIVLTGNTAVYSKNDYFSELENYIKSEGLLENILITGLIPRDEQLALIKYSEALIQPSVFEGWSTSIEDAKSLNTSVIASNIGVHKEQIENGSVFFEPGNAQKLANILANYSKEQHKYNIDYNTNIIQFARDFVSVFSKQRVTSTKKILHINASMGVGSTGRITKSISDLAFNAGYASYLAFGRGFTNGHTKNVLRTNNKFDAYFHGLITLLFDRHGFGSILATKYFVYKLKKIKPDLVHLHNLHGYYINIKVLFEYLKVNQIKIIWTQHDCWAFTGHCYHYEDISCEKWKVQCNNCPKKNKYPKSVLLDNSFKNYLEKKEIFTSLNNLTIVAPSKWLNNQLSMSFLKNSNIKTVYNGINLEVFRPYGEVEIESLYEDFSLKNVKIILGVANVWSNAKGFSDILKLASHLSDGYVIVLIGLKSDGSITLPKNIIPIDKTSSMVEMAKWYSLANVFINPTYMDTFPTTNLESIACGTPVITYKSGGSPEAFDLSTGFVIDKGDIISLKKVIIEICENGKQFYIESCRLRAEKYFNQDTQFKEYIKLYHEVLSYENT